MSLLNGEFSIENGIATTNPIIGSSVPNALRTTPIAWHLNENWPHGHLLNDYVFKYKNISRHEVYSFYVGADFSPAFLDYLSKESEWHIVYLLRDPRSLIGSYMKWQTPDISDTLFQDLVYNSKKRMENIHKWSQYDNFHLFSFEDLIENPLNEFAKMLRVAGLEIYTSFYQRLISQWHQISNSSFDDKGQNGKNRYLFWSNERKRFARQYLEEVMAGLKFHADW
jgi:hypothetical protein